MNLPSLEHGRLGDLARIVVRHDAQICLASRAHELPPQTISSDFHPSAAIEWERMHEDVNDMDLLRRFDRDGVEEAFAELVRRHLSLVHSAALRQAQSPQLAEEIAQSVFTDL